MLRKEIRKCFSAYSSISRPLTYANTVELLSPENRKCCVECMKKASYDGPNNLRQRPDGESFAAVLIAVCDEPQSEQVSILYTRRSANLRRHMRQISFPGGLKDESDADFVECALRETEEEIGLPRNRVEVWGTGSMLIPPRTASIIPVFATIKDFNINELKLNPSEVEDAFTLPIERLVDPSSQHYTQYKGGYSLPVFIVDKYRLWGITGYLTNMFLKCFVPNITTEHVKYVHPYNINANAS